MTLASSKRLGSLVAAATLFLAACSSGGAATAAPAQSQAAPTQAAQSMAAESMAAGSPSAGSGASAPVAPTSDVTLQGAGATFPAPLYQTWFETYNGVYPNIQIDYSAIGSGGGIKNITDQTVDFGASDAAMKDEEIAALKPGVKVLHVPTALGAVVVIYNVPDVPVLNLDADTIAGLFAGTITNWNDAKIAALNSGVTLPDLPVTVVHRSDGSGTTNAFTTYLDTVNADWHSAVGAGKEVQWPAGVGAQGNDGVAGGVKQTPGAVGYVELNYASQTGIPSAAVKNAAGKFVPGSTDAVTAAAEAAVANFPADFRQAPIINGAGDATYPIASYTYLLIPVDWTDLAKAQAMVSFTYWALTDGQQAETALGYAPLPTEVQQKAIDELHKVMSGGTAVWP